jgi:hypothetical protein
MWDAEPIGRSDRWLLEGSVSGFVPIPHAAIAAVRGALAKGAVLDLYSRAHQIGYGTLLVTDRELAEDWGVSRNDAWKILEQLAAAGCLELQKAAPRTRQPSRVTVYSAVSQTVSQKVSQNSRPDTPAHGKVQPDGEPGGEPPRGDDGSRARRDQTTPDPPVGGGEGHAREEAIEELLALQRTEQPDFLDIARDRDALRRALARGVTLEQLRALWGWSGEAQDKQARACRASRWRRWVSLLEGGENPAARLELAAAWVAAGRPAGTATGPPSTPARPAPRPRFSAASLLNKPTPAPGDAK